MYDTLASIAVITLNQPPVNSLGHGLRERIVQALAAAEADAAVQGVVLVGNDKAFSAGADVSEFGTPRQLAEPILRTVLAHIESCTKPVVAAISGVALGGGLEVTLACHARVALDTAKLGLPEITLGLIPGSGGTQRLPRLAGMHTALAMVQTGKPQTGAQLQASPLLNRVVTGSRDDLIAAAAQVAAELAATQASGQPLPRARDGLLGDDARALVDAARAQLTPQQRLQPAYTAVLDAMEAACGPFDAGVQRERELFLALVPSTQALAMRYQFFVEREASKPPVLDSATRHLIAERMGRAYRAALGTQPHDGTAPITPVIWLALVQEAAQLRAEGLTPRASDIDVVLVQDCAFPRWEGGPVFWAKRQERATLERDLQPQTSAAMLDNLLAG